MTHKQIWTQIVWLPWTVWCTIVFFTLVFCLFPFLVAVVIINYPPLIRWAHFVPPWCARLVLFLWGIRIKRMGNFDAINPEHQYIFVANHRSYLDALISASSTYNFVKFLGKAEILHWPVLGYLLNKFYVPVWRDDKEHRQWSMQQMQQKLETGASFYIFPEGTCNTEKTLLKHFHSGAFRLAIQNQLPIAPLTFIGTAEHFPRHGYMLIPGTVYVYYHTPISTNGMQIETHLHPLIDEVKQIMTADLLIHYPKGSYH